MTSATTTPAPAATTPTPATPFRAPAPGSARRRRAAALRIAWIRTRLAVIGAVAPRRAGAEAFALWCTIPGNPGRRKDFRTSPGEIVRVPVPHGGEVVAEVWGEGPVVYLVHGWGGWRGQLGAFVDPLVAAGFQVVGIDAPGHGDSDPSMLGPGRGTLVEGIEALEAVAARFGEAAGVVAHSMGTTAAAMVVGSTVPAERLVLIAPNHDFDEIIDDFVTALGLSARTKAQLHDALEVFVERPLTDFDLEPLGADGQLPPTLVLHDRRDKETPFAVGERLAGVWPRTTLVASDGLGHQRILADAGTIAHVVEFLAAR
jgi:pimeloyl-ACP methyl ester carboxylesterase